jgi:RNA polymerase sigma factor (sigma-70 family)
MPIEEAPSRINPELSQLAEQVADGDYEAFEEIHRRLAGGVFTYLRLLGAGKHADDLAQVIWASLFQRLRNREFHRERCLEAYVRGICRRELAYVRRTGGRERNKFFEYWRRHRYGEGSSELDSGPDAEVVTILRECYKAVGTAWALTDVEQRVLVERLVRGGTLRSVAKSVGISASTVDSWVERALEKMRRCFERKGYS